MLHWLLAAKQYCCPLAQSVPSPQAQLVAPVFGAIPFVLAHVGTAYDRHRLLAALQNMPVSMVHSLALAPHTHVVEEECGAEPSGWSQARAVTAHRHFRLLYPQSLEEFVMVLKTTVNPELIETQPRGECRTDWEDTLVSLNPSAATAFSHVARSSIHPHPFAASSSHLPDIFIVGENPKKSAPSVLHWLLAAKQYCCPLAQSVPSPQAQLVAPVFGAIPFVLAHVGTAYDRHRLLAALQNMPVSMVHSLALAPQTHVVEEECGAELSGWSHARAVTAHRHPYSVPVVESPQLIEEPILVLNCTVDPALSE